MGIGRKAATFAGEQVEEYSPALGIVLPVLPRREFHASKQGTDLFWAIALDGVRITEEEDAVGSPAQAQTTPYPTAAAAQAAYRNLIRDRVKAGWQPALGDHPYTGSLRASLMSALATSPDDRASQMAFADYLAEQGEEVPAITYRIEQDYNDQQTLANLKAFLREPAVSLVRGIVLGFCFGARDRGPQEVIAALLAARDRLVNLRAIFLGDITWDEFEISWIHQSDLTDLLTGFPQLEHFRTRGGAGLALRPFAQENLRSLTFEASNLPRAVVQAVGASRLPALEHLELWLGTANYGANTTPDDLAGILKGDGLPSLRSLGLRNSEIVNAIILRLATAPLMKRLRVLDLSLGTLRDLGAEALLAIPEVAELEKLDIHHHYVTPRMVEELEALGITVDASDRQEPEDGDADDPTIYRYVAHSE